MKKPFEVEPGQIFALCVSGFFLPLIFFWQRYGTKSPSLTRDESIAVTGERPQKSWSVSIPLPFKLSELILSVV